MTSWPFFPKLYSQVCREHCKTLLCQKHQEILPLCPSGEQGRASGAGSALVRAK